MRARWPSTIVDLDAHLVARHFLDLRVDAHRVLAATEILVGQEAAHFLEHRAVEGLAGREADAAQRLLQVLGLDVLVAGDLEALDRRALVHHDDERLPVAPHFDVAEEAGPEQRPDRLLDAALVEAVADVDRQVVVDRALGDALQALDADVADGEVRRRLRERAAPARQSSMPAMIRRSMLPESVRAFIRRAA